MYKTLEVMYKDIDNKINNYKKDQKFMAILYDYYWKKDLEENNTSSYSEAFKLTYQTYPRLTFYKIAYKCNIDNRTLTRYREKFESFALILKKAINNKLYQNV